MEFEASCTSKGRNLRERDGDFGLGWVARGTADETRQELVVPGLRLRRAIAISPFVRKKNDGSRTSG
jgi:hypothetical protein